MRTLPCIFAPAARQDLLDIGDYIHRHNPRRSDSFIDEIERYCHSISSMPDAYPLQPDLGLHIRRTVYERYLIFYSVTADMLRIERILHSARDINDDLFEPPV